MQPGNFDQPYPLRRRFVGIILPGLLTLLAVSIAVAFVGARRLVEDVYLEQAARRANVINRAMAETAPDAWRRLVAGGSPAAVYALPEGQHLLAELTREVRELDLRHLKIYGAGGLILYSTETAQIGTADRSPAFIAAEQRGQQSVVRRAEADGSALYELYVLVRSGAGPPVVFELYEPVDYLNDLLWRTGAAAAGLPGVILVILALAMTRLVTLAQRDIDRRSTLLADLRARLERLVSGEASRAVRRAVDTGGSIPSGRARCTIVFADLRDFTSFSEANAPEIVVGLLNQVLTIVVGAVARAGGDVDKMIGDAVLARFQGERAEARAIAAARDALTLLERANLPRGVGIGIYTGAVISGTVGPPDRMDFTIIGDAVNIAARLCDAAARAEIIVDAETVAAAGIEGFAAPDALAVKGRRENLLVRRWRLAVA